MEELPKSLATFYLCSNQNSNIYCGSLWVVINCSAEMRHVHCAEAGMSGLGSLSVNIFLRRNVASMYVRSIALKKKTMGFHLGLDTG